MRRLPCAVWALALLGCSNYVEFTLPALPAGTATSSFRWSPGLAPILSTGGLGEWDAFDVLNPSVVKHGNLYYNFYSGFDGKTWRTGLATSPAFPFGLSAGATGEG